MEAKEALQKLLRDQTELEDKVIAQETELEALRAEVHHLRAKGADNEKKLAEVLRILTASPSPTTPVQDGDSFPGH